MYSGASSLLHLGRAAPGQRENTETVANLPQPAQPRYHAIIKYGNYHGRLNGLHSNVLLGQITISKKRSKRVNENIATGCTLNQ